MVVNMIGKSRVVSYISRIALFEDNDFERVFSKKIQSCGNFDKLTFVIDDADQASFTKTDIVCKLRQSHNMRGSVKNYNSSLSAFIL